MSLPPGTNQSANKEISGWTTPLSSFVDDTIFAERYPALGIYDAQSGADSIRRKKVEEWQ